MKKTILLVDDEIDIQNRYFLQAGYDVLVAHDGKEGLELFRKKSIDVIITDIMMPNMDGYQATLAIRVPLWPPTAPAISRGLLDHPEEPAPDKKSWNFFGLRG